MTTESIHAIQAYCPACRGQRVIAAVTQAKARVGGEFDVAVVFADCEHKGNIITSAKNLRLMRAE